MFQIDLSNPLADDTPLEVSLRNGTAESTDYGFPPDQQLFYLDASGNRQFLSLDPSGIVTVPAGVTRLYAVVLSTQDNVYEGSETFFLDARLDLPAAAADPSGSAGARISDDGSAFVYATDLSGNLLLDPASGEVVVDNTGTIDDDRTLSIAGGVYSESSPYLFWVVQGNAGQSLRLVGLVGDPTGAEPVGDLSGQLQYRDATGIWQSLRAASKPVLDANGMLLIRKAVVNDDQPEGLENFWLTMAYPGGPQATGVSSLIDDGTGLIPALDGSGSPIGLDSSGNPISSPDAIKDDDRSLDVSGSTVNEASPFTFFQVDGAPSQLVTLSLNPGTADSGSDYINTIEYSSDDGKTWTLYEPESGLVRLNGDGTLLVRVPIVNDQPPVEEGLETFQLAASSTGGTTGTGTTTILDDGNGAIYNPDGTPNPSGVPDNDTVPPRIVPTEDGKGLQVIGKPGQTLLVDLSVAMADASLQNAFDLFKVSVDGKERTPLGAIGATSNSGVLGDGRYVLKVGETLRFVQRSGDRPANDNPDLQITGSNECLIVGLDDDGSDGDWDDLKIKVKTSSSDPYPLNSRMARFQTGADMAYLDLSWIDSDGISVNVEVTTDAGQRNTLGLVKVDTDANGVPTGTVGGVSPSAGAAFDAAVRRRMLSYSYSQTGTQTRVAPALTLQGNQAGVYAVVMTNENGDIFTYGNASSDGQRHVGVLGANTFTFEDLTSTRVDWDRNDFSVAFQIADPSAPRLEVSPDGRGFTVVGGTGSDAGLWLNLNAIEAKAGQQNSFGLVKRDTSGALIEIGSVGATANGTVLGSKEVFLAVGETLHFVQYSNNDAPNSAPTLQISQFGERYRVGLNDEGPNGDGDLIDYVVDVDQTPLKPCDDVIKLASLQTNSSAGLLDLTWIGADGAELDLSIFTDSGETNTLGFVKVDVDATTGQYSVDGVAAGNTNAFRRAVADNLIDFKVSAGGVGEADPKVWRLVAADKGIYAAVLITPEQRVYTFGDTAADGMEHVRVLGDSHFAFEDRPSGQAGVPDYNDFTVKFTPVV